ncbi:hypothetical protein RHMOL_Rhmol04G0000700 [Rhododendron molle]|uniref:Uncharacterized protein n=1 Tax=Rhododendron molle TaxID=49168 RepID=A0ACC0NVK9_RHOML|nr:hypothetical protein RHMOL_Rhmol04G0000700 [Rhododendron molle]
MYAANHSIPGYIPPGYNLLRTRLLQRERANIEWLLDPIKGTWKEKGLTIASDGWSDSQRSLINFMAVTGGAPMFLKADNCEGEIKDKHFITSLIKEVVIEVGPKNVSRKTFVLRKTLRITHLCMMSIVGLLLSLVMQVASRIS